MKRMLLTAVTALAITFAPAQQRHELRVQEAVDLAYRNVVELKNAQIDYELQEAKNREILGQAYPQLSGLAQASHYLKLPGILFPDATSTAVYQILKDEGVTGTSGPITKVPPPTMRQVSFQQPWNLAVGATLTQLLFQPDVFVGLQARETALGFSAAQVEQVKERVKDSAYRRYYAILIAEKQLFFMDEGLTRLRKLYRDDSVMYVNGFVERLVLDQVQVQINNLQTARNSLAAGVNISYAALKFALGLPQADTVVLKEELNTATIRENILSDDFRYENRAEIRTLGFAKQLQELDLKRHRLGYIPTISASANYSVNALGQKFFTDKNTAWISSSFIGLNVNIPIFDGFQRRYKIQQSLLNVQKMENTISNVKQAIDFEQVVTRQNLMSSLNNVDIQERNMALAQRVYNSTKLKFEQGLGSSFEVIQAETDLQTSQSNYFNALYNAIVARIGYLKSLGKLP